MPKPYAEYILGWLGYLFCAYAVCVLGWTMWKGKRPAFEKRLLNYLEKLRKVKEKGRAALSGVFAFGAMVAVIVPIVYAMSVFHYPEETQHNVRHIEQRSTFQWYWVSDEHPDGFMLLACDDMSKVIYPGYFAKVIRWQWRDNGACGSFRRQGYEIDYDWIGSKAKTDKEAGYGK